MSNSSPKPKWSARMGSVMRRTSSVLTISRPASAASERDADNPSFSSTTRGRAGSTLSSPPLPIAITPSPIAESPLREAAAEAQESVGLSPLAQPITSSEVVTPTLPSPVEETQSPTGHNPPPVIDSTVGNPGAYTDVTDDLPQPDIVQDPQAVAPVVEPATLNPPEPAEPEAIITEALVDEPSSYFVEPIAESIKDFEPVDHADNTAEVSEAVHGNTNVISLEPHLEQNDEATQYYRGDVIPTTDGVVPENVNIILPEPDLGHREDSEVHDHDDPVPVATEPEIQEEPQQKPEPIAIPVPVPVPHYDMPSYSMSLGSEREVWGGEHDHGAYPSLVPVVNSSFEDVKQVERSPAPSVRFVDFYSIFFSRIRS